MGGGLILKDTGDSNLINVNALLQLKAIQTQSDLGEGKR